MSKQVNNTNSLLKDKRAFLFLTVLLSLTSCGGGGGSALSPSASRTEVTSNSQSITAKFIDSPVKGLQYSTWNVITDETSSGITGAGGIFTCKTGDRVQFKFLGDNFIGQATCSEQIFLTQLFSNTTSDKEETIAALMLKINAHATANTEIDISGYNVYNTNGLTPSDYSTSNLFLNGLTANNSSNANISKLTAYANDTEYTNAKAASRTHIDNSILTRPITATIVTHITNNSNSVQKNLGTNVTPTSNSVGNCPKDLSFLALKFYRTIATGEMYVSIEIDNNHNIQTRVLSDQISTFWRGTHNSELYDYGSVYFRLSGSPINRAIGILRFTSGTMKCEYPLDLAL